MKTIQKNPVILCEEDYLLLKRLVGSNSGSSPDEMTLSHEIMRATVVKNEEFPSDTIRINSRVRIKDLANGKESEFTIVMPQEADIQKMKISILTPMGAALIGFRPGQTVTWKMPPGLKEFKILKVKYEG